MLTETEYGRMEAAYINAACAFLREAGVTVLKVLELENPQQTQLEFAEGTVLSLEQAGPLIGRMLREEFWSLLAAQNASVHVGYDYLMSIRVPHPCPAAEKTAAELGLYVERFEV